MFRLFRLYGRCGSKETRTPITTRNQTWSIGASIRHHPSRRVRDCSERVGIGPVRLQKKADPLKWSAPVLSSTACCFPCSLEPLLGLPFWFSQDQHVPPILNSRTCCRLRNIGPLGEGGERVTPFSLSVLQKLNNQSWYFQFPDSKSQDRFHLSHHHPRIRP